MYLYLAPQGGFNDILARIQQEIEYCKKNNRILLVDTTKGCYNINFSDFFYFMNIPIKIITDIDVIRKIIADNTLTIYQKDITDRNLDNWTFNFICDGGLFRLNNTVLKLPTNPCSDDIIVYSRCGGGDPISLFRNLYFKQNIIDHVKHEFNKLPNKYLCIQIRNTDYKCDYKSLYESNKQLIHSYETIYIATDDKVSIDYFRSKNLNIINFTEFPIISGRSLHYSDISAETKIKNLICDIYIIAMADKLLSNSLGGFINLVRNIRNDLSTINDKFN